MTDLPKPAGEYTRDEMKALLTEGAKYDGGTPYQAAVHILKFLNLPPQWLTRYVEVNDKWSFTYNCGMRVALVTSWTALLRSKYLGHTERLMLTFAASVAARQKISLDDVLSSGLGWAHVKVLAEAMFIRCGMDTILTVVPGGEGWDQLQAMHAEFGAAPEVTAASPSPAARGLPPLSDLNLYDPQTGDPS